MADSTVLWSEVDSSGGDGQRDCNGCGLQFSSLEVACTTSTEVDSQRDCICCTLQASSQQDHSYKERTYKRVKRFHLLPNLHCKLSRLQPLLVFCIFFSIIQCALSQGSDSLPERCYADVDCEFALNVRYSYNRYNGDCELDLCSPPANGDGLNSFTYLEDCQSTCMRVATVSTTPPPPVNRDACFHNWDDIDGCSPMFPTTRYSYNISSGTCEGYHSFNCEPSGDINSFKNLQQCEERCLTPVTTTPTPLPTPTLVINAPTPVTNAPIPVTNAPTPSGSGDETFPFTTPSQDNTSDNTNEISTTQDLITSTSIATTLATDMVVDRTTPTQRLNIYDHAIIGVGLLALFLCVILVLVIVVVMFKYRRRLALKKQEVMDSRRVKMVQAYRGKAALFSHNSLTASVQTQSYFSTV